MPSQKLRLEMRKEETSGNVGSKTTVTEERRGKVAVMLGPKLRLSMIFVYRLGDEALAADVRPNAFL